MAPRKRGAARLDHGQLDLTMRDSSNLFCGFPNGHPRRTGPFVRKARKDIFSRKTDRLFFFWLCFAFSEATRTEAGSVGLSDLIQVSLLQVRPLAPFWLGVSPETPWLGRVSSFGRVSWSHIPFGQGFHMYTSASLRVKGRQD